MKSYVISALTACTLLWTACESKKELYVAADLCDSAYCRGIEGPYYYKGAVLAVGYQKDGTIGITTMDGKSSLFVNLPEGSIGNGIDLDPTGRLVVADYAGHNVLMIDTATKKVSVYAHQDIIMNQPNDVCVHHKGYLYTSDPNWADSTGNLWMVNLEGKFVLLEDSMGTTNGVTLSPDDKTLYVNESIQRTLFAYDVAEDGSVSNKRLIHTFPDHGMDGMKCDKAGNLYLTRYDGGCVIVFSPEGKIIREIKLKGKKPTNIAFGGKEGKTAFVTMQDRGMIEYFEVEIPGKGW